MRTSKNNGMPAFFTVDELKLSANTNKIIAELNDYHDQLLKKKSISGFHISKCFKMLQICTHVLCFTEHENTVMYKIHSVSSCPVT